MPRSSRIRRAPDGCNAGRNAGCNAGCNAGRNARGNARLARVTRRAVLAVATMFLCSLTASLASAQIYKCTDDAGRTVYADSPCAAGGKAQKLPSGDAASSAAMQPSVCAQLEDERQRLAAAAARDTARGRKESADNAKRRQSLTHTYEARCIGIRRSTTPQK